MKTLSNYISEKLIINKSNKDIIYSSGIIHIINDMIPNDHENIKYTVDWGREKIYFKNENFNSLFNQIKYISEDEALNCYEENNLICYIWSIKAKNGIENCIYIYRKISENCTVTINIEESDNKIEIYFLNKEYRKNFIYTTHGKRDYVYITNDEFKFIANTIINIFKEKHIDSKDINEIISLIKKI